MDRALIYLILLLIGFTVFAQDDGASASANASANAAASVEGGGTATANAAANASATAIGIGRNPYPCRPKEPNLIYCRWPFKRTYYYVKHYCCTLNIIYADEAEPADYTSTENSLTAAASEAPTDQATLARWKNPYPCNPYNPPLIYCPWPYKRTYWWEKRYCCRWIFPFSATDELAAAPADQAEP